MSSYADDTPLKMMMQLDSKTKLPLSTDGWMVEWKMQFNETKCHMIAFDDQEFMPQYKLGNTRRPMAWASSTKYLGVIKQSDLKFDQHMKLKMRM